MRVKDIVTGANGSAVSQITAAGSKIYFSAFTSAAGQELWTSDGSEAGTRQVSDVYGGTNSSSPTNVLFANGRVFFTAYDGSTQVWTSDGTSTIKLTTSPTSPSWYFVQLGPDVFFSATATGSGSELWKTDGTLVGTGLFKDLWPGNGSGGPQSFTGHRRAALLLRQRRRGGHRALDQRRHGCRHEDAQGPGVGCGCIGSEEPHRRGRDLVLRRDRCRLRRLWSMPLSTLQNP